MHRHREPSINPQDPDSMAQLARDAGFANIEIVPTSGRPGTLVLYSEARP